jgi:hypothetical protein
MKDFLDRELAIGDSVIVVAPGYRHLVLARVISFTPKQVRVGFMNTWNYGDGGCYTDVLQPGHQLTRVDGPELTAYLLKPG